MRYKEIEYKDKTLKRISFKSVDNMIKHYSKHIGKTIYVAPINMRIAEDNMFTQPFEIEINSYNDYIDYLNTIKEIRYYNCVDELGSYLKYYIEK